MVSARSLPPAAVRAILGYLNDSRSALILYSLISQAWRTEARHILFSSIHLNPFNCPSGANTRLQELDQLLSSCPKMCPTVTNLAVNGIDRQSGKPSVLHMDVLTSILANLPNLSGVSIAHFRLESSNRDISLPRRLKLDHFEICNVCGTNSNYELTALGDILKLINEVQDMYVTFEQDVQSPPVAEKHTLEAYVGEPHILSIRNLEIDSSIPLAPFISVLQKLLRKNTLVRAELRLVDALDLAVAAPLLRDGATKNVMFSWASIQTDRHPNIPIKRQLQALGLSMYPLLENVGIVVGGTGRATQADIFNYFLNAFDLISTLPKSVKSVGLQLEDDWEVEGNQIIAGQFHFQELMEQLGPHLKTLDNVLCQSPKLERFILSYVIRRRIDRDKAVREDTDSDVDMDMDIAGECDASDGRDPQDDDDAMSEGSTIWEREVSKRLRIVTKRVWDSEESNDEQEGGPHTDMTELQEFLEARMPYSAARQLIVVSDCDLKELEFEV
ncbi:unnamed protein product [Somion occarium]|uniref:F-box domain-containing protein n=1 Tax=Somion occarium TaxID=3059160 RepID=A0ABP1DLZ2_9APHY